MNVPAWAFSNLCIGRMYDARSNRAGKDIFPPDIPTKIENVNTFSFRYKIVKTNEDVRDLLSLSSEISLKIKANIIKVEGAGKYMNYQKKDEEFTEVLAVMKCTTVNKTMDGSAKPKENIVYDANLGTHYVRSVTYGAEMIASLKFKSASSGASSNITGKFDGDMDIKSAIGVGLEAQLKKLSSECKNASDLCIEYYATDLPDKNPTNLEDLIKLIKEFPSRLGKINQGQGVPIKIELQPIENAVSVPNSDLRRQVLDCDIEEMESRYDDLCQAKALVTKYSETENGELDKEMKEFQSEINKAIRTFRSAISALDDEKVKKSLEVYEKGLDGNDVEGKFVQHWRSMLKKKIQNTASEIELKKIESRFDDLCQAKDLVTKYSEAVSGEIGEEMKQFYSDIDKTLTMFRSAICTKDKDKVEKSLKVYEKAFDGNDVKGKFVQHWRSMLKKKISTDIKLPSGNDLTIVLLGKTGNGKSATGNRILGKRHFESCGSASSVTSHCHYGERKDERNIKVIDTPGVLDTSTVKHLKGLKSRLRNDQEKVLTEVCRIYAMAPEGFNAIILVVRYGTRFTNEDQQALKLLKDFLGKEAIEFMILILTYGDQAELEAEERNESLDKTIEVWIGTLEKWVQGFIKDIENRVVLFNNRLKEDENGEAFKNQLAKLITVIDKMMEGKKPFTNELIAKSKQALDKRIKEALESSGFTVAEIDKLKQDKQQLEERIKDESLGEKEKKQVEHELHKIKEEIQAKMKAVMEDARQSQVEEAQGESGGKVTENMKKTAEQKSGGCFPASVSFVDTYGCRKAMDLLKIGDQVQVIVNQNITLSPVIAFIHRQPEVLREFLNITTVKSRALKMTEDHLLFVEKMGQVIAIPSRDVKIGDTIYVRENDVMATDIVQGISQVYEKGVYAPVTLSGTILVNDVHTSCYFDVLSHEWSHRAMGVARAVYYVSPWMVQWISAVGEKDGFPGWCRLAHKMLTFLE